MYDYDELMKLERLIGGAINDLEKFDRVTSSDKAAKFAIRFRDALKEIYNDLDEAITEEAEE